MVDEKQLIDSLRSGSEQAFNTVYEMYAGRLLSFCFSYTKSWEDAEEIVQATFLKLWQTRKEIRTNISLKTLLFKTAHHRVIDLFRKRVNSVAFEDYMDCRAEDTNIQKSLEYDQYLNMVEQWLHDLPPAQQRIFRLSRFDGLSNKEIAERLAISEKTVKNQISLATKHLRQMMNKVKNLLVLVCFHFFV